MLYPKFKIGEIVKVGRPYDREEEFMINYISKWRNFLGVIIGNDQEFYDVSPVRTVEFVRPKFDGAIVSVVFRYEELIEATEQEKFLCHIYGSEILVEDNAKIC